MCDSTAVIAFNITGAGWADLVLRLDDKSFSLSGVSYTTDVLGDLTRLALMIATGAYRAEASFDGEPLESRLVLTSHLDVTTGKGPLSIAVFEFADISSASPVSEGHQVFIGDCQALDFARAVLACVVDAAGTSENDFACGFHAFPLSAVRALQAALAAYETP